MKLRKIEQGVRLILQGLEVDPDDRNYKQTPERVARMYEELFTPRKASRAVFPESYDDMVVLRGHKVHGVCPHHLLPVAMQVYLGYIPHKQVLGLSKLARVIETGLTGPVLQEAFTRDVAERLNVLADPKGVGIVVVGQHGCMQHRGVKTTGDIVTSCMKGIFLQVPHVKEEFMRIVGRF